MYSKKRRKGKRIPEKELPARTFWAGVSIKVDPIILKNTRFKSDVLCECAAATSITIGAGGTIEKDVYYFEDFTIDRRSKMTRS